MGLTRQLLRVSVTNTTRCRQDIGLWNVRHPLDDMAVEPKSWPDHCVPFAWARARCDSKSSTNDVSGHVECLGFLA